MSRQMKWKLSQAVATFVVLWILFARLQFALPKTLWVLLFLATLTFGISLLFSVRIPTFRRWAIAYLILVGLTYFLAALITLLPHWGLILSDLWDSLITPFPMLALIDQCFLYHPCKLSQTSFSSLPITDDPQLFFSLAAMVVSLIAVAAASLLAKDMSSRIPSTGDSPTPQVPLHESRSFPMLGRFLSRRLFNDSSKPNAHPQSPRANRKPEPITFDLALAKFLP